MKKTLLLLLLTSAVCAASGQEITPADKARAAELVARMSLDEKLAYIGGYDGFYIRAIPRLGIPAIRMADGPQGVRNETLSTLYPCGVALAATWNRELAYAYGRSLGRDARARGVHIMLGPGVNIYRSPLCGRNFEYYGEDPFLASETAVGYIRGIQGEGVMATIKHFCGNNQEYDRHHVSSDIDERTLHEIYLPTFRKAVEQARVGAVMSSYNMVNCVHTTENGYLVKGVVRGMWGFDGIYMSDWDATYSVVGPVNNGLDLEMPGARFTNPGNLRRALAAGTVTEGAIDEKCCHILQTLSAFGFLDREQQDASIPERDPESAAVALDVARQSAVLLKNDGLLPLDRKVRNVVVMGPNAGIVPKGGGSGEVSPFEAVSVGEGMSQADKRIRTRLLYAQLQGGIAASGLFHAPTGLPGLRGEYFANRNFEGQPTLVRVDEQIDFLWQGVPVEGLPADHFSVRWTGVFRSPVSQWVEFRVSGDDGYRLFIDDQEVLEHWGDHSETSKSYAMQVDGGRSYDVRLEYYDNTSTARVALEFGTYSPETYDRAIAEADAVVYCAGFTNVSESENGDRTFGLPGNQAEEIAAAAALNPNVILVVHAGGGVDFAPVVDKVRAILHVWYAGQAGGTAVADILTGRVNPSGHLPITIERRAEENPTWENYRPNVEQFQGSPVARVCYNEGVFVGYRGYDRAGIEPMYPFGFGLSYTTFAFSDLRVEPRGEGYAVSFDVTNTGRRAGAEVAQVYVGDPQASVPRPEKELKGYEKVFLRPGETRRVEVMLDRNAFAYWDMDRHGFRVEPGDFVVSVGASSRDLPLSSTICVE